MPWPSHSNTVSASPDAERVRCGDDADTGASLGLDHALPADCELVDIGFRGEMLSPDQVAALHAVRQRGPTRLVCAVPVASPDAVQLVGRHCDEVVCLAAPAGFRSVGQFYAAFPQLEDDEVVALLAA